MREGKCRSHIIVEWENGKMAEILKFGGHDSDVPSTQLYRTQSENAEVAKGVERGRLRLELTLHSRERFSSNSGRGEGRVCTKARRWAVSAEFSFFINVSNVKLPKCFAAGVRAGAGHC